MRFFLFTIVIFSYLPFPAFAESSNRLDHEKASMRKIISAGEAMRTKDFVTETPFEYVNFYDRRFDYKESRDALRANIEKRRQHYNSARSHVIRDYKGDLKNLNSRR